MEKEDLITKVEMRALLLKGFINSRNWKEANYMARDIANLTGQLEYEKKPKL